jgi:DNA polymerase III gamma/tau subunit
MLRQNYAEKYFPNKLDELPINKNFINLILKCIQINTLQLLLIGDDEFSKSMVVTSIINSLNMKPYDKLFISKLKDQGVTNIRYELKQFCQTPSHLGKKILIIDDIHMFSENIQKLLINNIDKWQKNIHVIITCNNMYNVDEGLVSRLFPICVPPITMDAIKRILNNICILEEINITSDIKDYIIQITDNKLQSIYHILEKCKLLQYSTPVTMELLKHSCTLIKIDELNHYFTLVKNKKLHEGYKCLIKMTENGYSVLDILNELYLFIKITGLLSEEQKYKCCTIISVYIVTFITIHEDEIELLLFTDELIHIF